MLKQGLARQEKGVRGAAEGGVRLSPALCPSGIRSQRGVAVPECTSVTEVAKWKKDTKGGVTVEERGRPLLGTVISAHRRPSPGPAAGGWEAPAGEEASLAARGPSQEANTCPVAPAPMWGPAGVLGAWRGC